MQSIKRPSVRAYLLLESLITMALLSILVSIVLTEIVKSRAATQAENQQIEALNVAQMAVESNLDHLSANGAEINIVSADRTILITNHGEELLKLEANR